MLAYAFVSYHVLKRKLRGAVALEYGVLEDPAVRSPFLLGYLRPRIYLPCGVPEEHRGYILSHERCHIRRGDNWVKLIGFVCLALHWYNPLVWLAYSLLCKDMEMACDEAVIRTMDIPQRKAYSAALLSCAAGKMGLRACPVAFGEDNVKQRILKVLHYRKPAVWLSAVALIAVAVLAVCFLTNPAAQADPTEPSELDPMEKCRLAVEQLQKADSYALREHQSVFSVDNSAFYVWDMAFHLCDGDNGYHLYESSDFVWEYFAYDGRQFAKTTTNAVPEEDNPYLEWTETDISDEPLWQERCWLLDYQWEASRISLQEVSPDGVSTITLSVRYEQDDVVSAQLQFCFDSATGKLSSVSRKLQKANGVSRSTIYIQYNDEMDIAATLSTYYQSILSGNWEDTAPSGTASAVILTQPSDRAYEAYKTFFYSQFGRGDEVIFADVTHDGEAEMLVLHKWSNGEFCNGYVYTMEDSNVRLLYSNSGGLDHASGFYSWYLKPVENGYNLAEETFDMNNGIGTVSFEEYYLRPDGQRVSVDRIYVSSEDSESRDEAGTISEEAANRYMQQLNARIASFYLLHNTYTLSSGGYMRLDMLWQLFQ